MKIWFGSKSKVDKDNPTSLYDVKIKPKIELTEEERKSSFDKALNDALKQELREVVRRGLDEYVFGDRYREQLKVVAYLTKLGYEDPIFSTHKYKLKHMDEVQKLYPNADFYQPSHLPSDEGWWTLNSLYFTEGALLDKIVEDLVDDI